MINNLNKDLNATTKEQIKTLETEIKALQASIEEKQKLIEEFKSLIWPSIGDQYYNLRDSGQIEFFTTWHGTDYEKSILEQGNIFKTLEEVRQEKDRRIILTKLKKYTNKNGQWVITYKELSKKQLQVYIDRDIEERGHRYLGLLYFSSKEMAENAIRDIGSENIIKLFN